MSWHYVSGGRNIAHLQISWLQHPNQGLSKSYLLHLQAWESLVLLLLGILTHLLALAQINTILFSLPQHSLSAWGVTFRPHVTSAAVSPPWLSAEEKGKSTTWRQDLEKAVESDIVDTRIKDTGELEIAHLVSLWSDQWASDTVNKHLDHEEVMGRLITGSRNQEFWE